MGIAETLGDERSASHIEQEERRFTRCRVERRLRREMAAGKKAITHNSEGGGGGHG
jgi:hypothetical protein